MCKSVGGNCTGTSVAVEKNFHLLGEFFFRPPPRRHYKPLWTSIGNISLQHVGVLSVYVVHGLMCVAFLVWHAPLGPVMPWYMEHTVKGCA